MLSNFSLVCTFDFISFRSFSSTLKDNHSCTLYMRDGSSKCPVDYEYEECRYSGSFQSGLVLHQFHPFQGPGCYNNEVASGSFLSLLHSLESFGLGRGYSGISLHAHQVSRAHLQGRSRLGVGGWSGGKGRGWSQSLGTSLTAARFRRSGNMAASLGRCCSRRTGSLATGCHGDYHRLGGGGTWTRAARMGRGHGIRLHQFGFRSLCILPEMSTWWHFTMFLTVEMTAWVKLKFKVTL